MKKSVFFIPSNLSRVFPFILFCLFCASQLSAATWYVKPSGNDASAGNSWATAYLTLTKALQSAASGDQIWVAAGTYKPTTGTDRTVSFNMKTGVAILGGFPASGNPVLADRDWETHVTTLSGDIGTPDDNSDNSYHVISNFNVGISAVLDGFTLTAGLSNSNGGGMYCISSSPVINNCRFVSNGAAIFGGGLFCGQNSNAVLNNCFFYSNYASSVGGGISSQSSSLTISNTVFSGNSGTSGAGLCVQESPAIVTNCVFSGNSAGNLGGGMLTWNAASFVVNCSFSGNQATSLTGGFVNYGTTSATLKNCIIWGNQGSGVANVGGGTALVTHSIVQGGYDGTGNLNINPLFVNAPGDLRLQACSPAINKGNDTAVPAGVTTDLDGNNRFFGTVDMGAYEYQSNAPPLVAACKNLTVQLNAAGNASVPASAADNGSTGCGSLTYYLSQTNFNCSNVGINNLLFVVSDNNFHSASCAVTVTVQDNTAPTAICQNTTLQLDASGNASLTASAINNGSADACGIASLALSKTAFNCSNLGDNSVTLSVTDNNGKTATCSATVTVQDNIAPTAVCKDATVPLDATGNVNVPASAVDNGSADACGNASQTLSKTAFNCTNIGANSVTLTVTDNHGKTATCAATVTIQDNTLPTAICKNATVQLDATGNVSVPASAVNNGSTDACGIATLTLSKTNFNCSNVGNVLVSLEVKDNTGNKAYCSTTLTVQDNVAPTAICQNTTLQLDASGSASLAASAINNGSADACGIASLSLSKTTFDCSNIGTNTVTLTATDNNGKTATCSATVTVQDNVAPTALCQNATVQLDATGNATLAASAVNNGSADACGIASLSLSKTTFDCSNIGANTVTLTVTDNNGKTATCSATVTVPGNTTPTAVCKNITVQLDATGYAQISPSDVDNGSTACGPFQLYYLNQNSFGCFDLGQNIVTFTVVDNSYNSAYCTATVTVKDDNVVPVAVCNNPTVQLDANGHAAISIWDVDYGSYSPCEIISRTLSKTDFTCSNIGANAVTLTVTDHNGKTATCSATVTVQDNVPIAICKNATVQLDATGNVTVPASAVNNGSTDACGIAALTLSKNNFNCLDVGNNSVSLEVMDNNGNKEYCWATVTVQDNVGPTATCQNATVQLDATGNASLAASAINNGSTDACGIASLALSKTAFDCSNVGVNAVTLTVTDGNNNTSICSATVTVQDNIAPAVTCPDDITVTPSQNSPCSAAVENNLNAVFGDNCSVLLSYVFSGATTGSGSGQLNHPTLLSGVTTITYTVNDQSEHFAQCVFHVTVSNCVIEVSGKLIWENDDASGVGNATIALTGDESGSMTTTSDGLFSFSVAPGSDVTLTPTKTINKLNGITTADATRIQQHVANISLITDPYKLVAADVNKSSSVTTQDASIINQSLLGNPAALAQFKTSWRFVPVSHPMNNPPWGFPERIALNGVEGDGSEQDFFGIKTGDVLTPYTDPVNFSGSATSGFVLNAADQPLQFGEQVSIVFSANQFSNLAALQFALKFDVEKLLFAGIEPLAGLPFSPENFGTYNISEGEINIVWSQAEGVFVEEAAPIFKLTFNVLETGGTLSEALQLAEEVLPGHAYTSALTDNNVKLNFFGTTSANDPAAQLQIELLQNHPNPFADRTTIGFVLPEASAAQLRIIDASGKIWAERKAQYPAGKNEELFELNGATGVLYCELTTPIGMLVKKMVAVKN